MVFLSPLALLCSALVALPVAIHLLVRRRSRRLDFPTLRYLRETPSFRLRPQHLQQPLLLALRILALALLVIGFARPLILSRAGQDQVIRVILLDASFSMNAPGRTEAAREQARNLINRLNVKDRAALIECSTNTKVLATFTNDRPTLLRALDQYQPESSRADYAAALDEIDVMLESEAAGTAEIDLISDFQQSGFTDQKPFSLRRTHARILTFAVGALIERNAFLTNETISAERGAFEIHATEIVSTDDGRSAVSRAWTIDAPRGERPGIIWQTESNNQITGYLKTLVPDDFDADDTKFFAFAPPRPLRVLLIEDSPDANVYLRAALEAAINANAGTISHGALEERRDLPATALELKPYSHVLLTLHDSPRAGELNVINEYARRGGIVWLWLAPDMNAAAWNAAAGTDAGSALPFTQLKRSDDASGNLNFVAADTEASPVRFMAKRSIEALRDVRVRSAYEINPREDAATAMRWSEAGSPALVSMRFGDGLVLACATSAEHTASELGQSAALPALAFAVLRLTDDLREPLSQTIGEPLRLSLSRETPVKVFDPKNRVTDTLAGKLQSTAASVFREPGIYRVEWQNGLKFLALNAPAAESERAISNAIELKKSFPNTEVTAGVARHDLRRDSIERQSNVWRYFLLSAFVLFIAELFVAAGLRRTNGEASGNLP